MIAISLACDRLWSHSSVNDLIAIRSWSRQALVGSVASKSNWSSCLWKFSVCGTRLSVEWWQRRRPSERKIALSVLFADHCSNAMLWLTDQKTTRKDSERKRKGW